MQHCTAPRSHSATWRNSHTKCHLPPTVPGSLGWGGSRRGRWRWLARSCPAPPSRPCVRGPPAAAPGGRESAPSTAISVHFQLFPHWPPIGRAPQQRLHCAAIGSPLAGQCTNYVTVQRHVTCPPPCWTADCCADDCSSCHSLRFCPQNIANLVVGFGSEVGYLKEPLAEVSAKF